MCFSFWAVGGYVIFFKLRRKNCLQIQKMTTIFTQNNNLGARTILCGNSHHLVNLLIFADFFFLSQHEKNQVTQLPTAKK